MRSAGLSCVAAAARKENVGISSAVWPSLVTENCAEFTAEDLAARVTVPVSLASSPLALALHNATSGIQRLISGRSCVTVTVN